MKWTRFALTALAVVAGLALIAGSAGAGTKHPTYALGKAKHCKTGYVKIVVKKTHNLGFKVKVKGKWVEATVVLKTAECEYIAVAAKPPTYAPTTTTVAPSVVPVTTPPAAVPTTVPPVPTTVPVTSTTTTVPPPTTTTTTTTTVPTTTIPTLRTASVQIGLQQLATSETLNAIIDDETGDFVGGMEVSPPSAIVPAAGALIFVLGGDTELVTETAGQTTCTITPQGTKQFASSDCVLGPTGLGNEQPPGTFSAIYESPNYYPAQSGSLAIETPITTLEPSATPQIQTIQGFSPMTLATNALSGLAVTYQLVDPGSAGCALSAGVLSAAFSGTCTVTAAVAGSATTAPFTTPPTTITII